MEGSPFWWNNGRTIVFARRDGGTSKILAKSADGIGEEQLLFQGLRSQSGSANQTMCLSSSGKYFIAARATASGKPTTGYFRMEDPDHVSWPINPFSPGNTKSMPSIFLALPCERRSRGTGVAIPFGIQPANNCFI